MLNVTNDKAEPSEKLQKYQSESHLKWSLSIFLFDTSNECAY